ncbi:probable BOI-related E3 ubiquitin-protein ligase 2 [Sesamum indicum]|uniref:RING-type E3 ubiquitin transferase n=1 Tax=Sesamum indicum TaxID=4182 RepID=A0A6I9UCS6_SESIN|nr:probable BOI-related E3 ubiquitin-protein ligase 2 [Sesamum indicum]
MAVEARHLSLFPPQILNNRELMMNSVEGIGNAYGAPMGYGLVAPLSGTTTATETVLPIYGSAMPETVAGKTAAIKSDSGLTYAVPISRKRPRDAINPLVSSLPSGVQSQSSNNRRGSFTFLGEDFSFQFQQQQLEIDRFIAQHTEKVRMEIEERRKRYSRRIAAAVEENIMKKLKAKEEEIDKIGKLNWALEERVKSLCVENQIWRDLAQTNEATANALRCNLEQVLAQVQDEQQQQQENRHRAGEVALMDDAESCCGSNFDETGRHTLVDIPTTAGRDRDYNSNMKEGCIGTSNKNRMCRNCGKEESCVLLLPCRHLCLCTVCGSSLHTCPVCNSTKTASVHVNLSAS